MISKLKAKHDRALVSDFKKRTPAKTIIYLIAGSIGVALGFYLSTNAWLSDAMLFLGALLMGISIEKLVSHQIIAIAIQTDRFTHSENF